MSKRITIFSWQSNHIFDSLKWYRIVKIWEYGLLKVQLNYSLSTCFVIPMDSISFHNDQQSNNWLILSSEKLNSWFKYLMLLLYEDFLQMIIKLVLLKSSCLSQIFLKYLIESYLRIHLGNIGIKIMWLGILRYRSFCSEFHFFANVGVISYKTVIN